MQRQRPTSGPRWWAPNGPSAENTARGSSTRGASGAGGQGAPWCIGIASATPPAESMGTLSAKVVDACWQRGRRLTVVGEVPPATSKAVAPSRPTGQLAEPRWEGGRHLPGDMYSDASGSHARCPHMG